MDSITARNTLFQFLEDNLNALFETEELEFELLYHSNILPETNSNGVRVYVRNQIVSEQQDTLSVDVVDCGRVRYNTVGACVVSFFTPRSLVNGYAKTERIAQALKQALRKKRFEWLLVRNPMATPYNVENNSYRYDVSFSYEFDEII